MESNWDGDTKPGLLEKRVKDLRGIKMLGLEVGMVKCTLLYRLQPTLPIVLSVG